MLTIIAGHVAVVALVMSAKMDLPEKMMKTPLVVEFLPQPEPPPPTPQPQPKTEAQPERQVIDQLPPRVPLPAPSPDIAVPDARPSPSPTFEQVIGPSIEPLPRAEPLPPPAPAKTGARLLTAGSDLRPPYPASKIAAARKAVLRLRLAIDERGRVRCGSAVGPGDRAFLEAARRHLIAHWRYKPASEGGRAVATRSVITLRFQLEG
jgi:protein TonB